MQVWLRVLPFNSLMQVWLTCTHVTCEVHLVMTLCLTGMHRSCSMVAQRQKKTNHCFITDPVYLTWSFQKMHIHVRPAPRQTWAIFLKLCSKIRHLKTNSNTGFLYVHWPLHVRLSVCSWAPVSQRCMHQCVQYYTPRSGTIWRLSTSKIFAIKSKMAAWQPYWILTDRLIVQNQYGGHLCSVNPWGGPRWP